MYRAVQRNQSQGENNRLDRNHLQGKHATKNMMPVSLSKQLKKSWLTAIIGSIMFVCGMCFLFWNEGRAVRIVHSLDEALRNVVVLPNSVVAAPEYEGSLVHLSGPLQVLEPLTESDYGVVMSCVKLKRRVQMYQWVEIEEEQTFGGVVEDGKRYYYTTEWKDKLVDSDHFYIRTGHENPKEILIKSQIQIADDVKIGAFTLGTELKDTFNNFMEITSDERPERKDIKMHSGLYYHSANLWDPQVGDIRLQFSYAGKGGDVYSVIGLLEKNTIKPYYTTHGEKILLQQRYKMSVKDMLHLEHVNNYWRTWLFRAFGWLVLFVASTCLANVLQTIVLNSTFLCGLISTESLTMSVSMSVSLLVIGLAWVWYKPLTGFCIVMMSSLPFILRLFTKLGASSQQHNTYTRL